MAKLKPRQTPGRYHSLAGAFTPPNGLGRPPVSLNVRTRVGQVADPGSPGGRIVVAVNRVVDVLEDELSHNRINEAEYQVGRIAQFAFERARGRVGTSNWQGASRVDAYTAKELAVLHRLESAERITRMIEWWRRELGRIDANILERVLGEGKTYAEVASLQGKSGERGVSYIANRFRDALKALADLKSAKGLQATRRPS